MHAGSPLTWRSSDMEIAISIEDLQVSYNDHVALEIPQLQLKGNVIAILGHNGAGKSTLIKTILGLLEPKRGLISLSCSSQDQWQKLYPEKHMAFCPETGSIFEDISVEDYIRLWCRIRHRNTRYYKTQGARWIELLDIAPLFSKLGRELSKGQRRRVQTAIGFLCEPRLFLFDEPFDGLDIQKTTELADIIRSERSRTCFVISSHRMDVMERLADEALILQSGRIISHGTVSRVSQELSGQRFLVANLKDAELTLNELRQRFVNSSINRLGNEITLVGKELELAGITAIIEETDRNGAVISRSEPTLTDAMNYHLRSMRHK